MRENGNNYGSDSSMSSSLDPYSTEERSIISGRRIKRNLNKSDKDKMSDNHRSQYLEFLNAAM